MPAAENDHKHYWIPDALCVPTWRGHAVVLFRCKDRGCELIAYGHAIASEIQEPR